MVNPCITFLQKFINLNPGAFEIGVKWVLLNVGVFYTVEENLGQLQLVGTLDTFDINGGDGNTPNNSKFVLLNSGIFYSVAAPV